jgi:hypothetical protein
VLGKALPICLKEQLPDYVIDIPMNRALDFVMIALVWKKPNLTRLDLTTTHRIDGQPGLRDIDSHGQFRVIL